MKVRITALLVAILGVTSCQVALKNDEPGNAHRIQPYTENPAYWQYKAEPVLLLGASDNDNLFQSSDFRQQLDALAAAAGNYVRNTMSSRDSGDVWAYAINEETGLYDLNHYNPAYWKRLDSFLEVTAARDVIVQIEVWATFDFYDGRENHYPRNWRANPFNPKNNSNYTIEESGLPELITSHPTDTENPFFFSVPDAENNTVILAWQEAFVDKLLSHTFPYGHVLYCMDNETSVTPAWGAYWAAYIQEKAREKGILVQTTEMWDPWDLAHEMHSNTFDNPDLYSFVDVSQNNHQKGQAHWDNAQKQRDRIQNTGLLRPLSNVKVYGANSGRFGNDRDGIERYWRNVFGGMASTRFHRPDSGLGVSETAQMHVRALRMLTDRLGIFDASPRNEMLLEREENEAYLTANDRFIAVFFPDGGAVDVTLEEAPAGKASLSGFWLDIQNGKWLDTSDFPIQENRIKLTTPGPGYQAVLISR